MYCLLLTIILEGQNSDFPNLLYEGRRSLDFSKICFGEGGDGPFLPLKASAPDSSSSLYRVKDELCVRTKSKFLPTKIFPLLSEPR